MYEGVCVQAYVSDVGVTVYVCVWDGCEFFSISLLFLFCVVAAEEMPLSP